VFLSRNSISDSTPANTSISLESTGAAAAFQYQTILSPVPQRANACGFFSCDAQWLIVQPAIKPAHVVTAHNLVDPVSSAAWQ
jgi:hypothetical protein